MPSIFTKVINQEIPAHKIYEDDKIIAILDIRPHNLGHTLVIPKEEIGDFADLPANLISQIFQTSQLISKAIWKATKCKRVGLMVHGMGVPEHFHLHLVPLFGVNDFDQSKAHTESEEKMQEIQKLIIHNLQSLL